MPFMRLPNTTRKDCIFLQALLCQMDQMIPFSRQINQKSCNVLCDFGSFSLLFFWSCDVFLNSVFTDFRENLQGCYLASNFLSETTEK